MLKNGKQHNAVAFRVNRNYDKMQSTLRGFTGT